MSVMVTIAEIESVKHPEDIFGTEDPRTTYHELQQFYHPDKHSGSDEASKLINALWAKAKAAMAEGTYGQRVSNDPISFKSRKQQYVLSKRIAVGETCAIYSGEATSKEAHARVIVRIPHSHLDNDLMGREAKAFQAMRDKGKEIPEEDYEFFGSRLPIFIESIKLSEPGAKNRKVVNTFAIHPDRPSGWVTLEEVRKAYPNGVDPKHAVWMWNRFIEGLTFAHSSGIMHGALTPNHLIVHPPTHLGQVIDWTASGKGKVPYQDRRYRAYFNSPNLSIKEDIYTLAMSIVYVLGGDPEKRILNYGIPTPITSVLNKCLQPKAKNRYSSMVELHHELEAAAEAAYGPKKFIPFSVQGENNGR